MAKLSPFAPNAGLRLAQLATLAQGALGVTTGITIVRGAIPVSRIGLGVSGTALIPFGVAIALQCVAVYFLAVRPPTYRAFAR